MTQTSNITSLSQGTQVADSQPVRVSASVPVKGSTTAQPKAAVRDDTVTLSTIAQSAAQEALETQAQTAKEAGRGDNQARRLLAREAATQISRS